MTMHAAAEHYKALGHSAVAMKFCIIKLKVNWREKQVEIQLVSHLEKFVT